MKNLLLAGATALATVVAPTMNVFAQEVSSSGCADSEQVWCNV